MKKIIVKKADAEMMKKLKVELWPVWESPVTEFDWEYGDDEICYFIDGEVTVKTEGEEVKISKGDIVVFPKGLKCRWLVSKPVKKHYSFALESLGVVELSA